MGASLHSVLISSLVQRGQAQVRSTEASSKGFHSVQRDQDQQDGRTEVTTEPTAASPLEPLAGEDHLLSGQLVLVVSLQTWLLWDPFPPNIWEVDQGLYK